MRHSFVPRSREFVPRGTLWVTDGCLGGFSLEAGLLGRSQRCLGLGRVAGGEILLAVLLLGHLLAERLEALCLGAEAADLDAAGFLRDEVAHREIFSWVARLGDGKTGVAELS